MKKVRVQRERPFCPHHLLLNASSHFLNKAAAESDGATYMELSAITFSALALEAMANSFGSRLVSDWDDYETASPIAKLRLISSQLRIEVDFTKEPWSTVKWLTKFRNRVAHAKPELIEKNVEMTLEEYEERRTDFPKSKLEGEVSLSNAERSVKAVDEIFRKWYNKVPPDELNGLFSDGWSDSAEGV